MTPGERYVQLKDAPLDYVLLRIKRGEIKAGRYTHIVNAAKNPKIGKEYGLDGTTRTEAEDFRQRRQRLEAISKREARK